VKKKIALGKTNGKKNVVLLGTSWETFKKLDGNLVGTLRIEKKPKGFRVFILTFA
jgi:hypothetical protein